MDQAGGPAIAAETGGDGSQVRLIDLATGPQGGARPGR
jgi:hypothetical protein